MGLNFKEVKGWRHPDNERSNFLHSQVVKPLRDCIAPGPLHLDHAYLLKLLANQAAHLYQMTVKGYHIKGQLTVFWSICLLDSSCHISRPQTLLLSVSS